MHITLKDILKLTKIFIIISALHIFSVTASEEVTLNLYGYGSLYWGGGKHKKPEVYPLTQSVHYVNDDVLSGAIKHFYKKNDKDNQNEQANAGIYFILNVKQYLGNVIATVLIRNDSSLTYYVHKQNLPVSYSILSGSTGYCGDMFLITTSNIRLDYLGGRCEYNDNTDRNSWIVIPAKKELKLVTKLNESYAFPKKTLRYNIGSLEFSLVNENWFIRKTIFEKLFSILNFNSSCFVYNNQHYVFDGNGYCEDGRGNNVESFLLSLGFYDYNNDSFLLRTNQVIIEIDGRKISSAFDGAGKN